MNDDTYEEYDEMDEMVEVQFAVCVKNDRFPASLEIHKIYQLIPDDIPPDLVRVIVDKSGESYLYPRDYFVPIDESLPGTIFREAG